MLEALHESIQMFLNPSKEAAAKELQIVTKANLNLHTHFLRSSHVSDIPEAEDLFFVKSGNKTFFPCHMCHASRSIFSGCISLVPKRNAKVTLMLIEILHVCHEGLPANKTLHKYSMLSAAPFLSSFPFTGIHLSVEVYSTF